MLAKPWACDRRQSLRLRGCGVHLVRSAGRARCLVLLAEAVGKRCRSG